MSKMKWYDWISLSLVMAGALNWGLIGLFNFNLVETVFGNFQKIIYILVGVAFGVGVWSLFKNNK